MAAAARKTKSNAEPAPSAPAAAASVAPAPAAAAEAARPYVVFARRFRPNTFSEVAGQTAVTGALKQALKTGRVAQAYLFCGPRGVGKTSLARIFAKALNCQQARDGVLPEEPCNACPSCLSIQDGRALDVIEMDAATNRGIEEIRSLRENVGISPAELRCKVYIIDEVHMLTREAWNAFLKTLEEPPPHVKFVFATTDPNDVPETILSRCQRFDLRRIGPADIVRRLEQICVLEKVDYEPGALSRIASLSRGGLRDAEGLLDQAVNLGQGKVTEAVVRELSGAAPDELVFDLLRACAEGRTADVLGMAHTALENGADPDDLLGLLIERLRGTLLARVCGEATPLLEGLDHLRASYKTLGELLSEDQCLNLVQLFTNARRQMRDATQARLPLEMALIRAARARELVDLGKLVSALESGARPAAPTAAASPPREGPRPNPQGRPPVTVDALRAAPRSPLPPPSTAPSSVVSEAPAAPPPPPVSSAPAGPPPAAWPGVLSALESKGANAFLLNALRQAQVQHDASAHRLFIEPRTAQRMALKNAQNAGLVCAVVQQVLGADTLVYVRQGESVEALGGSGGAGPAPASAALRRATASSPAPVPARPAPTASNESDPVPEADVSEEVDDLDAMTDSAPSAAVSPVLVPEMPSSARGSPVVASADTAAAEKHPLVRYVLKESKGLVTAVSQSARRMMNAANQNNEKREQGA